MTIDDRPPPLTPEDCDLREFPYMPLVIQQLKASKQWLICKRRPDLAFYLLNLWTAAWHEVPAASIEDDADVLADKAMCPPDRWDELKGDVMRGWTLCADGRWYHPIVAEQALKTFEIKRKKESEKEADRLRKEAKKKQQSGGKPKTPEEIPASSAEIPAERDAIPAEGGQIPTENALKGLEGKGREEKELYPETPPARSSREGISEFQRFWEAYPTSPAMSRDRAEEAWQNIRTPRPDIETILACVAGYRDHLEAEAKTRKPSDPPRVMHAANWLAERRWSGFEAAARQKAEAERKRIAERMAAIPLGLWRDVAETYAATHSWQGWDNAVLNCRLIDGEPLCIEYPTNWAMNHARQSSGMFDRLAVAALKSGVTTPIRPMVRGKDAA